MAFGPSASSLEKAVGGLTSHGCSSGLQAASGFCRPLRPGPGVSPQQASRSPTCWRVAIGSETELHEHDGFSIRQTREAPRTSAHLCPACKVPRPASLQSLSCLAPPGWLCGGPGTLGMGTAARHPRAFLLLKPHRLLLRSSLALSPWG